MYKRKQRIKGIGATVALAVAVLGNLPASADVETPPPTTYDLTYLSDVTLDPTIVYRPHWAVHDSAGDLYVVSRHYSNDAYFLAKMTEETTTIVVGPGLESPPGLAAGTSGGVYLSDSAQRTVRMLDADGTLSNYYIGETGTDAPVQSIGAMDVAPNGSVVVADHALRRITAITAEGTTHTVADFADLPTSANGSAPETIHDMAYSPTGDLYLCMSTWIAVVPVSGAAYKDSDHNIDRGCLELDFNSSGDLFMTTRLYPIGVSHSGTAVYDYGSVGAQSVSSFALSPNDEMTVLQFLEGKIVTIEPDGPARIRNSYLAAAATKQAPEWVRAHPTGGVITSSHLTQFWLRTVNPDGSFTVRDEFERSYHEVAPSANGLLFTNPGSHEGSTGAFESISRLAPDGTTSTLWPMGGGYTHFMAEAPDGAAWTVAATSGGTASVRRYSADGMQTIVPSEPYSNSVTVPWSFVVNADNIAFINDRYDDRIFRVDLDGNRSLYAADAGDAVGLGPNDELLVLNDGVLRWLKSDGSYEAISIRGAGPGIIISAAVNNGDIYIVANSGADGEPRVARLRVPGWTPPTTTTTTTQPPATTTTTTTQPPATTTTTTTQPVAPNECERAISSVEVSNERQGLAARLYMAYFLRQPDGAGYEYWSDGLQQGWRPYDVSWSFANSTEFVQTYGSLSSVDFLALVYKNVMCRPADRAGADYWASLLDDGTIGRSDLMLYFADSVEFRAKTGT